MKSNKIFSLLLLGAVAFGSCNSEDEPLINPLSGENQVKFQASIGASVTTRAAGTTWNAGDAIGVYALNAGQKLPDGVYDSKSNIKYTTPTEAEQGVFTAATEGITFPETGNLDFIAYYPYRESLANNVYAIDVADQSKPAAIDLLFSNNAVNQSEPAVALQFKHQLAMLVLNVSAGDGVTSLDGLTVSIEGLKTDGTFNLADGSITTGTTVKTITPVVAASGKTATVAAILVPGQDLKDTKISFKVGGQTYEWTPDAQAVETGKKYTYPSIQLSTTGVTVVQPSATIVDWVDVEIGGIVTLKPNEGEQGSWTVAELRSKFTGTEYTITEEVKVKAVVIQNKEGGNSTSLKNIVIQDETAGIAVRFVENNETLTFGDEVEISLKDQKLSAYNGLLQINNLPNANVTKTGTKTVTAKEVTAADFLAGKYESQYVAVPNVQVVAADLEKTFATDKHGSINMEFENGGQFILFTSSYAVFKNQKVPQGSGTLKGIASINQPKDGEAVYQILPTVAADVEGLTQSRFGSSTSTLEVSPSAIEFEASANNTQNITITASGAWTATTEGSGFTISPASGTGNATIVATATAATGATGKIIVALTETALTKEIAVSQKTSGGEPTVIFSETFENATPLKEKFNSEGTSVSGFDFADGKYTGTGADVRTTGSITSKHLWFPGYNAKYDAAFVKISNIPSGYTSIKLTYDIAANAKDIAANILKIKCNNKDIPLSEEKLGEQNVFSTITIDIPIDDVTTLEFYTDETNTSGFRLDNIKLEGVKK
ncbi:fimbrillin family protein [Limibacterium fermenti]|uniref:fimbrillin family protein n=1 Tax=Limibacterium fermenti TaxID=3229863 RepID=UPI003A5FA7A6